MGGIVKSIGKAIKGIGKAIKKILPILLVAAAVYIGYGYMTGFQAGGWPQITNWGKSLVSGVGQGQTISTAATAATDMTAMAGAQTAALGAETATAALGAAETGASTFGADALTAGLGAETATLTALPAQEAVTATALSGADVLPATDIASTGMIGQAGGDVASAGMIDGMGLPSGAEAAGPALDFWPNMIEQSTAKLDSIYSEVGTGLTDAWNNLSFNPVSDASAAAARVPDAWLQMPRVDTTTALTDTALTDVASINQAAADQVMSGSTWTPETLRGTGPQLSTLPPDPRLAQQYSPNQFLPNSGNIASHLDPTQKDSFFSKLAQLGKKGWEAYKKMWADNPGMAMWTTSNVLKTILAMLDDTDEKLAARRAYVGGFESGGYPALAARYDGNLPGGRGGGAGYTAPSRRSMQIKSGPIPEANRGRSSAVNRTPATPIRSTQQGQV